MTVPIIEGPYHTLRRPDGTDVPWYVVPFDECGRCTAPRTRARLLEALRTGDFTHVYLFSHGWNNDWADAVARYGHFVGGFATMRSKHAGAGPCAGHAYRPLLVGVFWPSTSLVLPWERAPRFAAAVAHAPETDALAVADDQALREIAAKLPDGSVERFYELAGEPGLERAEAGELAELLLSLLGGGLGDKAGGGADGDCEPLDAADLVAVWMSGATELRAGAGGGGGAGGQHGDQDDDEPFGTAAPVAGVAVPEAAGWLDRLDPRHALRMATVWRMKDRAGTVGAKGVHDLLRDVLGACDAAVHAVGHSYGAKVVLSAVAAGALPRQVASVLLLQPAVSHLCFAADADGKGRPGGYRTVLDRVHQPVLATFSSRDFPLARVFHLAVRRPSDLGEQLIAADVPPSRFAALGGYGPGGMSRSEHLHAKLRLEGEPYPELGTEGVRVVALDASAHIGGHGDVSNPSTWWALHEQVRHG